MLLLIKVKLPGFNMTYYWYINRSNLKLIGAMIPITNVIWEIVCNHIQYFNPPPPPFGGKKKPSAAIFMTPP